MIQKRRKGKELPPIYYKPYTPENTHLSKAEYVRRNNEIKKINAAGSEYVSGLKEEAKIKAAEKKALAKAKAAEEAAKKAEKKAKPKKKKVKTEE